MPVLNLPHAGSAQIVEASVWDLTFPAGRGDLSTQADLEGNYNLQPANALLTVKYGAGELGYFDVETGTTTKVPSFRVAQRLSITPWNPGSRKPMFHVFVLSESMGRQVHWGISVDHDEGTDDKRIELTFKPAVQFGSFQDDRGYMERYTQAEVYVIPSTEIGVDYHTTAEVLRKRFARYRTTIPEALSSPVPRR